VEIIDSVIAAAESQIEEIRRKVIVQPVEILRLQQLDYNLWKPTEEILTTGFPVLRAR